MTELVADDADLCRRVLAGETQLYADLVRRHQVGVFRVAAAMLRDATAADAIVQQVFVSAFEHLDQFKTELSFAAWVKAIARNAVRKEALRVERDAHRLTLYRAFVEAATSGDPKSEDEERQVDDALRGCREALAPVAARALALRYDEGQSLEQVAAALGRGLGATRQLLFRIRTTLRDCLSGRLHTEESSGAVRL